MIVSGEAPSAAMDSLRSIVSQSLPKEWRPLLRDHLDPAYVAAIGAARLARKVIEEPQLWHDPHEHSHSHDEL